MEKQQSVSGYKVDTFKMKGSGLVASDTHNLLKKNGAKGGTRTPTGVTPPDPKSTLHTVDTYRSLQINQALSLGFSSLQK